ncbi:MAG: sugar ABC transporter substrate-binding protein [Nitrososphaeria archaeon]
MGQEPKKVGRRTFINYAIAVVATGVIVGVATYFAVPKGEVTVTAPGTTITKTVTTTITGTPTTTVTSKKIKALFVGGLKFDEFYIWAIDEFKRRTGIEVEYTSLSFVEMTEKETVLCAAKSSEYDVYSSHYAQIGKFIEHFEPLEGYLSKTELQDYPDWTLPPVTFNGHLIALPRFMDARLLYYRTDLYKEYGIDKPPSTWNPVDGGELVSIAKKLTVPQKGLWGLVMVGKGDPALRQFSDLLWQAGGDFLDEKYNPIFNSDAGVDALTFYSDLIYKYKVIPPGTPGYEWSEQTMLFAGGTAAMIFDWPSAIGTYDDPSKSSIVDKYDFSFLPAYKTSISTAVCHLYAINKYSINKGAAFEFIKFLTSTEARVKEWEIRGSFPASKSAIEEILKRATGKEKARLSALDQVLKNGESWPTIPEWGDICPKIWDQIEAALIREKSPKEALDKAAEDVKAILRSAGYYK